MRRRAARFGGLLVLLAGGAFLGACGQALEIGRTATKSDADAAPPTDGAADMIRGDDGGSADGADGADGGAGVLWTSTFEGGDTTEWSAGGGTQGGGDQHGATTGVAQDQSHGGTHAYRISIDTTDRSDRGAELFRRVVDGPAYYSAWYFISEAHAPTTYWTVFAFMYEMQEGNVSTRHSLWDVNLNDQFAYFENEATTKFVDASPRVPYPVGRWFHLEARFAYEGTPRSAHITVWQDGTQILDVSNLGTAPTDFLYWAVVNYSNALTPPVGTIYIDDAAISTQRLGP